MRRIPYYGLAVLMVLNMAAAIRWHHNGVGFSISLLLMLVTGPLAWRCTGITLPDRILPKTWDTAKWLVYLAAPLVCIFGTGMACLDELGLAIVMMLIVVGIYIYADRLVHRPETRKVHRSL